MASSSFLLSSARPNLYICARCSLRAAKVPSRITRRWIGIKYLAKVADAEYEWQEKAAEINAGRKKSMLTILEERGLVKDVTGTREQVDRKLTDTRIGAYVGVDPTASSLHVGHLLPFMSLFWMYVHGYHAVSILGGATAKIGDPSDRLTTRTLEHASVRTANMVSMHYQLKKLWLNVDAYGRRHGFFQGTPWAMHRELVNNNAWWNKMPMLEVLQVLGHGMRLGPMLARDTVKNKMSKGDGMSFAEFTYPLMQAWDWWTLYHSKGIQMQIGGSDQYGNITAGIDAVKHIAKNHPNPEDRSKVSQLGDPFGLTVPLLTTSSGEKFGKSAGNAVWLDSELTSVFDLYGYFLRTSDADVGRYLKIFTFMPIEAIDQLLKEHMEAPSQRKAQHMLARELIELVHGAYEAKLAEEQHRYLFTKKPQETMTLEAQADPDTIAGYTTLNNKPRVNLQLPRYVVHELSIGRILFAAGLAASASEGHRLAQESSVYIGGPPHGTKQAMNEGMISWTRIKPWKKEDTAKFLVNGDLLMLRRGKSNIRVIQVIPDEEFDASGKTYPGQKSRQGPTSNLELRNKKVMQALDSKRGKVHISPRDNIDEFGNDRMSGRD